MGVIQYQPEGVKTWGVAPRDLCFYLVGAGAAAPTFGGGCPAGMIASITRSAAGKYTLQLSMPVQAVIEHESDPTDLATPDGSWSTIGNIANEGTSTGLSFQVSMFTPGATYAQTPLADLAVGRKLRVRLRLQLTKWGVMT